MAMPRKDPNYKRKMKSFALTKTEMNDIKELADSLGMNQSAVIRYLVAEAKKNQSWRNVVRNLYEIERRQKAIEIYEKTHPAECTNYKTTVKTYTVYGTVERHPAVDQQQDDTIVHEEVSNEEIKELLDDYYKHQEDQKYER